MSLIAKTSRAGLLAIGLLSLNACVSPTPYQAASLTAPSSGGYSQIKIEENRYRLKFAGNSQTARDTVENYMLYRAAELTLDQGYDWFSLVVRDTHEDKRTVNSYDDPFSPYGGFSWRYYRRGWSVWGAGMEMSSRTHTYSQYEASAEIVMGKGAKPADDKNAYDAREVKKNLEARILRPTQKPG